MEEKLPQVLTEELIKLILATKEGQLLFSGYLIGKGIDTAKSKIKLKGEFTLIIE